MRYEEAAHVFCEAIKDIAGRPENLANLESYLTYNFPQWLQKFANTPVGIASEMQAFASMEFDD